MLNKYLLIILVLFTSCKKAEKSSSDAPLVDLKTQIQTGLVNVSCTGCHAEPTARNHQVDLSDVSKGIKPANPAYIIPGCPDQSLFYTEMKVGSMPPRGPQVDAAWLAKVKDWISGLPKVANCSDEPGSFQ